MSSENTLKFTDENFEQEVLNSDVPVLVDFWAEWCMPCKMLVPTIDELAADFAGKAKVGKIDTDANRETAMKFGISSIPTIIYFKDGEVHKKFLGIQQKAELAAVLEELL